MNRHKTTGKPQRVKNHVVQRCKHEISIVVNTKQIKVIC